MSLSTDETYGENFMISESDAVDIEKDDFLYEAKALIEQNTLESCELAVKKLAQIKGFKDADELLDAQYKLLCESTEHKKSCLAELDSNFGTMKRYSKKVNVWRNMFMVNIFLMIISTLVVRLVMSDSEIFMIFGIPVLAAIVTLLVLFTLSLIKIRQYTNKFEILAIGRKTKIFRDKSFFANKIQNAEIEMLNAQKYIISAELILKEIEEM